MTTDDLGELPPCACIPCHGVMLTGSCLLHNPADGLLVEQPVQFTGLLGVLDAATRAVPMQPVPGSPGVYEGDLGLLGEPGVVTYDMVLPSPPRGELWTPFRELHYRGDVDPPCYRTASGSAVHVKPDCRCCR